MILTKSQKSEEMQFDSKTVLHGQLSLNIRDIVFCILKISEFIPKISFFFFSTFSFLFLFFC